MLSISLPGIFEGQDSGYLLRVSKVTLKWTGPVKNFTKCQLGSNLMVVIHLTGVIRLDLDSIPTVGASVGKVGF